MSRPYVRPFPRDWWWKHPAYRWFMLREISSVFVALYALELLCLVARLPAGVGNAAARAEYLRNFFEALRSPGWVLFHVVALGFTLLHSITWFELTPKVMVVRIGENKLPDGLIAGANFLFWGVVSLGVWWIMLG